MYQNSKESVIYREKTMSTHFYIRTPELEQNGEKLTEKSLRSIQSTKSENTIDAYESDWNDFCDWCTYHHQESFPASPETVVNYINDLADYAKAATIRRRISAISENYNAAGFAEKNPCKQWIVKEALIGITRLKGSLQTGKTPLYWEEIKEIINGMNPKNISCLRDKALLLTGFLGAFRRSEIISIDLEDIRFVPQGIIINIRHSKTDQTSEGQMVGIPYIRQDGMDCVRALQAWIGAAKIETGPLFRRILKGGKVSDQRLSDKSVNLLVKRYAKGIGLNPVFYGAHSLRHGFATYAALHHVEERLIMKQTRHRSVEMVRRYINEADLFTNNPIDKLFNN